MKEDKNIIQEIIAKLPNDCSDEARGIIFESLADLIKNIDAKLLDLSKYLNRPEVMSAKINSFWSDN
jgi:hypothetical protein